MEYPQRKTTRIPGYDYSTQNYYFVTICTHEKKKLFGNPNNLNSLGAIAAKYMEQIPLHYPDIQVEKYVIMPNHVHAILILGIGAEKKKLPNLTSVVGGYKSAVSKNIRPWIQEGPVWQRSFHDHIIRNQNEFEKIWLYIEGNPFKWEDDCFFSEN